MNMKTMEEIQKEMDAIVERQKPRPYDIEADHCDADDLLCEALELLGYPELVKSFNNIEKYYA